MPDQIERLRSALLNRYSIIDEIGHGGMATVYLARDLKHERDVAIKVLQRQMESGVGPERFLREIRTVATLTHPHILPLYDSGEVDGVLYYVMPYVKGESLRDRLTRETRLSIADAVLIAREAADGLAYAHAQGVVHRDIKPENILLSDGHAVVADFGIARAVEEAGGEGLTATGLSVGTPAYMSPEQALGDPRLDGRTDVYSLACVLYEMLAGETPFAAPDARAILARKTSGNPSSLRDLRASVPAALENAVEKALMPERADRFGSASEFAGALENAVTPAPMSLHHTVLPEFEAPAAGARRVVPWLVGLVLLAVVVSAWWLLDSRKDRVPVPVEYAGGVAGEGVAVLPFRVVGMDPDLWRAGMVDALSSNLDGLGGLRKIDPRVVLANWAKQFGEGTDVSQISAVLQMAGGMGARYAVLGSLVNLEGTATLSADVYDVRDGTVRGAIEAVGSPDDVTFLTNQATIRILDLVGDTGLDVTELSLDRLTRSGSALRAYLRGELESRRFRWEEALDHFDEAIAADSTFGLALYRASLGCEWTRCQRAGTYLDLAQGLSDRLARRDQDLMRAHALRVRWDPEAIPALEDFVVRYPDEVAGWYELGEAYFHLGPRVLEPWDLFRGPFRRVLELDPGFVTAYSHLLTDAFVWDDSATFAGLVRAHRAVDTTSVGLRAAELAGAVMWGDSAARSTALARLASADAELHEPMGVFAVSAPRLGDNLPNDQFFFVERALIRAHAGQPDSAWIAAGSPDRRAEASVRLSLHVRGLPSSYDPRGVAEVLGDSSDPWSRFLVGALAVQEGRWEDVQREIGSLTVMTRDLDPEAYGAGAARALEAYAEAGRGNVGNGLAAMEKLLSDPSGFESVTPPEFINTSFVHELLRQEAGMLLLASGRLEEASRYFESVMYPIFGINVGLAEACLGETYERLGERELAARHLERLVGWWQSGEPGYRAVAESGRSAAMRLREPAPDGGARVADGLCERALAPHR